MNKRKMLDKRRRKAKRREAGRPWEFMDHNGTIEVGLSVGEPCCLLCGLYGGGEGWRYDWEPTGEVKEYGLQQVREDRICPTCQNLPKWRRLAKEKRAARKSPVAA